MTEDEFITFIIWSFRQKFLTHLTNYDVVVYLINIGILTQVSPTEFTIRSNADNISEEISLNDLESLLNIDINGN